jgi:vacuolar protein sorting-associated protein 35
VNVKQIIISLIDRLAAYAAREAEGDEQEEDVSSPDTNLKEQDEKSPVAASSDEADKPEEEPQAEADTTAAPEEDEQEEATKTEAVNGEETGTTTANEKDDTTTSNDAKDDTPEQNQQQPAAVKKVRGIPQDVELFVVFWGQIVELVKVSIQREIENTSELTFG